MMLSGSLMKKIASMIVYIKETNEVVEESQLHMTAVTAMKLLGHFQFCRQGTKNTFLFEKSFRLSLFCCC